MTKTRINDPFSDREAKKYSNPIPSREFILDILKQQKKPLTRKNISQLLGLSSEQQFEALRRRLKAMERDGQLLRNRKNAYGLVSKMNLVTGRVMGHPDGFGFVIPDDGSEDLFLNQREMRVVLHGDRVVARMTQVDKRGKKEGAVVEVIQRANQRLVGRLFADAGIYYIEPTNRRISQDVMIPSDQLLNAKHGQVVEIEITHPPSKHRSPLGSIVSILGDHMAPGMEIDIALRDFELPHEWSRQVTDEANSFGSSIPEQVVSERLDIRSLPLVTIDGEDARDFDDAVYAEKNEHGGWRLYVAIADVSHYVTPQSPLDISALERGTSVYFPSQVIPMLPEVLSNGLCSLNPEVDRLCLLCRMTIDEQGQLIDYQFDRAVMRSSARLTYDAVNELLVDQNKVLSERHADLLPHLETLHSLYQVLHENRKQRGAIDFELTETQFIFDSQRKIKQIQPRIRHDAHRMIEECMIAANVAAAQLLVTHQIAAPFRSHEPPSEDSINNLREFLSGLGLALEGGVEPSPKHYAALLEHVSDRNDKRLVQTVVLRSQKQALYTVDNKGHFGLSLAHYTHFTSPIRRYPDLLVHRAICQIINGNNMSSWRYSHEDMIQLADHCSMTSRRADEASRDVSDWLKCEFMRGKVGESYSGVITGVTGFGVFVELDNIFIEGLVHITALKDDYYNFDAIGHKLTGERTNISYRVADKIYVKVVRVDLDDKKIELELA